MEQGAGSIDSHLTPGDDKDGSGSAIQISGRRSFFSSMTLLF